MRRSELAKGGHPIHVSLSPFLKMEFLNPTPVYD